MSLPSFELPVVDLCNVSSVPAAPRRGRTCQATRTARNRALPARVCSSARLASVIAKVSMIGVIPCRAVNASISVVSLTDPVWPPTIDFSPPIRPNAWNTTGLSGMPMMHSFPCGRSAAMYSFHGRSLGTVQKMKSNERAAFRSSSVPRVAM